MKFLHIGTKKTQGSDLAWGFLLEKHTIDYYPKFFEPVIYDKEEYDGLVAEIRETIEKGGYDAIISWNYFYYASDACEKAGIPYMAWLFDSPLLHVYATNLTNSCNYIFAFDKAAYEDIKRKGGNVYYLPLAVNTLRLGGLMITDEDIAKYGSDVSFVGSLYQNNPYRGIKNVPKELSDIFDGVFEKQLGNFYDNYMYTDITAENLETFSKYIYINGIDQFPLISPYLAYVGFFIAREYASRERVYILNKLAEKFSVTLYNSADDKSVLKGVRLHEAVEYENEAPKVFFSSKINLNFSVRSIERGIPLRCFDIMGVGGFLMSNYQEAFDELFVPGKEMVYFKSEEELMDLTRFYLTHEEERLRIAMGGFKAVNERHTIQMRVASMIKTVFGERAK